MKTTKRNTKHVKTRQGNDDEIHSLFAIDEKNLVEEWEKQPELFLRYSMKLADARRELDEEKAALSVVNAELDRDIRENPEEHGVGKVTDASVKAAIPLNARYQKQERNVRDVKHRVDILSAYVDALDQRKKALEKIVDLHGQQYWSVPRSNDDGMKRAERRSIRNPK